MRLAIDAGSGLVIPSMLSRDEASLPTCGKTFNIEQLVQNLGTLCPQMPIRTCGNWTGIAVALEMPYRSPAEYRNRPDDFRTELHTFVNDHNVSMTTPVAVRYGDPFAAWNYTAAGEHSTIQKELFGILTFNSELLALGTLVHEALASTHGYIGIHLRAESDWPEHYGNISVQTALYLGELARLQKEPQFLLRDLYISCGDQGAIQTFRILAQKLGFTVHDKWTLLEDQPEMLERMEALDFDRKAIVEYEVLVKSSYFFGAGQSTFSMLVALGGRGLDPNIEGVRGLRNALVPSECVYTQAPFLAGDQRTKVVMVNGYDLVSSFP